MCVFSSNQILHERLKEILFDLFLMNITTLQTFLIIIKLIILICKYKLIEIIILPLSLLQLIYISFFFYSNYSIKQNYINSNILPQIKKNTKFAYSPQDGNAECMHIDKCCLLAAQVHTMSIL